MLNRPAGQGKKQAHLGEWRCSTRAPVLSIFDFFKFVFLKFQKNVKLFPGMHIHIPNTRCKFRYKSRFVLDYRKKNKFLTVYRRKKVPFLSEIYLFCISQNTKYFFSRFLPVLRNMCMYSHICFQIFLSIESVFFKKFKYQEQ